uniref:Uncharacterized protein n=1 Tax=Tetraselmis sp. GSL018 TaxID=582737 RepID=A0A061RZX8_9CHLO
MHKVLDRAVVRTKISDIDEHLRRLTKNRARWASTPLRDRAKILKELRLRLLSVAEDWAIRTSVVKGLEHDPRFAPAELMTMCATLGSFLHRLEGVLLHAGRRGRCPEKGLTWIHTDQLAAKVFPSTWADQLNIYSLYGFEMETWIQPGKPPSQVRARPRNPKAGGGQAHPCGGVSRTRGDGGRACLSTGLTCLVLFREVRPSHPPLLPSPSPRLILLLLQPPAPPFPLLKSL